MNNTVNMKGILPKDGFFANAEEHKNNINAYLDSIKLPHEDDKAVKENDKAVKENDKAVKFLAALAAKAKDGDVVAQYYYGVSLALGYYCEKNHKKAFLAFMQASAEKEVRKEVRKEKEATPQDGPATDGKAASKKKHAGKKKSSAEKKHVQETDPAVEAIVGKVRTEAQLRVGDCFYYGRGVARSYVKAFHWYGKAAGKDNAEAQLRVGDCFFYGKGVACNYVEASRWYGKAEEKGITEAKDRKFICDKRIKEAEEKKCAQHKSAEEEGEE